MAVILYRYAQNRGFVTPAIGILDGFVDSNEVSEYATEAIRWAVGESLISRVGDGRLASKD